MEEINFLSRKDDWKKIEKNNVTIALNVFYAKKDGFFKWFQIVKNNAIILQSNNYQYY